MWETTVHTIHKGCEREDQACVPPSWSQSYKKQPQTNANEGKIHQTRWQEERSSLQGPLAECNCVYVGETGRSLEMRLKEHRYAVKTKDSRNGIVVHADTNNHEVDGEAARMVMFEEHQTKKESAGVPADHAINKYHQSGQLVATH